MVMNDEEGNLCTSNARHARQLGRNFARIRSWETSAELRRIAQYGFDAISRWLADTGPSHRRPSITCNSTKTRSRAKSLSKKARLTRQKPVIDQSPVRSPSPSKSYQNRSSRLMRNRYLFRLLSNSISTVSVRAITICIAPYSETVTLLKQRPC